MAGWQEQVAENARRYAALQDRLATASATETSRDGVVRVTVSADGSLTDLVLEEPRQPMSQAMSLPELADQIMRCVRRARAQLPGLIERAMSETVGHDESAEIVLADARRRFPQPPPEPERPRHDVVEEVRIGAAPADEPRRPPARRRVHRQDDGDDGWHERPILEDI
jgi:hypothetical protein